MPVTATYGSVSADGLCAVLRQWWRLSVREVRGRRPRGVLHGVLGAAREGEQLLAPIALV